MKDGEIVVKDKVRGRKKVIKWLTDYIKSNNININDKVIGLNHVNDVGCTVAAYSSLSAIDIYFEKEA